MQQLPWYRVHIVTCLAVLIVGAALLWCQAESYPDGTWPFTSHGWPLMYKHIRLSEPQLPELHGLIAFAVNLATALLLMLGTGFIIEQITRRTASLWQFTLTAALVVITALAVMLGERYAEFNMYVLAERLDLHATLLAEYPWYLYAPIYFAIFCTLCSLAWIIVALITRWFRSFDR